MRQLSASGAPAIPAHVVEGKQVCARVLHLCPSDGLAIASLKGMAVKATLSPAGVQAGKLVTGTVVAVGEEGVRVQLAFEQWGWCPRAHMSEGRATHRDDAAFKPGVSLQFRVLRQGEGPEGPVLLTHKKTLVLSSSFGHGRAVLDPFLSVHLPFSMTQWYIPPPLSPSPLPFLARRTLFPTSSSPHATAPSRALSNALHAVGSVIPEAPVVRRDAHSLVLALPAANGVQEAVMAVEHLADQPACAVELLASLRPGSRLGPLLVLSMWHGCTPIVTAKPALLQVAAAAGASAGAGTAAGGGGEGKAARGKAKRPQQGSYHMAFVTGVRADGSCSVQLADGTTAVSLPFSPTPAALATLVPGLPASPLPAVFFSLGQTVRAKLLKVALDPFLCASHDGSFASSLLQHERMAARLAEQREEPWMVAVVPGMAVEGTVLVKHEDAMGAGGVGGGEGGGGGGGRHGGGAWTLTLVSPEVLKGVTAVFPADLASKPLTLGERVSGRVVDVGGAAGHVLVAAGDIDAPVKSGSAGQEKRAVVLVRGTRVLVRVLHTTPYYAVVSLPPCYTLPATAGQLQPATSAPLLATLAGGDFNLPHVDVPRLYRRGQTVAAAVVALPTAETGGRIVLARDELVSFTHPSSASTAAPTTAAAPAASAAPTDPTAAATATATTTAAAAPAASAAATPSGTAVTASGVWQRRHAQLRLLVGADVQGEVLSVTPSPAGLALVNLGGGVSAILRAAQLNPVTPCVPLFPSMCLHPPQFPSSLHAGDIIKARVDKVLLSAAAAAAVQGKGQGGGQGQKQGKGTGKEDLSKEERRVVEERGMCVLIKRVVVLHGGPERGGEVVVEKKGGKGEKGEKGEKVEKVKKGEREGLEGGVAEKAGRGKVLDAMSDEEEEDEDEEEEEGEEEMEVDEEDDRDEEKEGVDGDGGDAEEQDEEEVAPLPVAVRGAGLVGRRRLPAEESDEEEGVEEESEEMKKQRKKRAKKREKEARERAIQEAEQRRVRGQQAPETEAEFEQLLLASPNSSFLWIKFMAFLLSLSEIDKARAVAERALKSISYREEGEKLNIWVAYLNLENMHGNPPKEAVLALFQRGLAYTDPKKLHVALLGVFERSQQHDMADTLLHSMAKKFSTSAKVWLRYIQNQLSRGLEEGARKLLERALTVLPQRKHIKVISQAALMEYRIGSQERGRTLFENILRNFPKRTDLWITYIDQEVRMGDMAAVRRLFERVVSLDLPPKKMKSLLKKYLDLETAHGTQEHVAHVKARAVEYVQHRMGAGGHA
ncbi:unnamed protein product [Closterium sp. NIES-54]